MKEPDFFQWCPVTGRASFEIQRHLLNFRRHFFIEGGISGTDCPE